MKPARVNISVGKDDVRPFITDADSGKYIGNIFSADVHIRVDEVVRATIEISAYPLELKDVVALTQHGEALVTKQMIRDWLLNRNYVNASDRRFAEQLAEELK